MAYGTWQGTRNLQLAAPSFKRKSSCACACAFMCLYVCVVVNSTQQHRITTEDDLPREMLTSANNSGTEVGQL